VTGQPGLGVISGPVACTSTQAVLGEGLRWDTSRAELIGIDILAGRVYRGRVVDDGDLSLVRSYELLGTVGAITPVADDDGWVLAAGRGFVHLLPDGSLRPIVEFAPAGTRMNDGACDPVGRFWAGTLADDFRPGGGSLYRLDHQGRVQLMLSDLTISNGLGWSPDGSIMYLADSGPRVVHAFEFDVETGTIGEGRVLIAVAEQVGTPDGLTVDLDGDLWVAIYGGGRIHRYAPDGRLRQELPLPAAQSTSCAFAGPLLNRLYVTTATEGWSDEQRREDPAAGLVYRFDTDVVGRPATPFRPDQTWWTDPSVPGSGDGHWSD
jgi:sugar lactone lactonase YvrE